ncbi:MAG: ABC transporter permease [Myxococcota bacterium]
MRIFSTAALAIRTLWANPFRTLLTMLSVTIGAFSIVGMLSLAESGHNTLSRQIEEIGGMRLVIWFPSEDHAPTARDRAVYDRGFTDRDLQSVRSTPYVANVAAQGSYGREAVWASPDKPGNADVTGVDGDLLGIVSWKMLHGRGIEDADNLKKDRVAVLTAPLAEALFDGRTDVIGQTIFVGRRPYTVVGVLQKREMMGVQFGFSWDMSVFVPLLTAEQRDGRPKQARFFVALTDDASHNDAVVNLANASLLANHRGIEDFQSLDFSSFIAQFYTFFRVLDLIVAAIASISLFAGGIGVMNIMLVSVTERIREIGIRRSLGATRRAILSQFLIEASTLSVIGGLIGVGGALLVVTAAHLVIKQFLETWVGSYSALGLGLAVGVTAGIGLVFGALPAWRASRLDVVECLRR